MRVVVSGAGVAGLLSSLLLAREGHDVVLLERDATPLPEDAESAFAWDRRGAPQDWWALAWLRGTEIATDAIWAESPAINRPGAKLGLRFASVSNLAMAIGFAWLSKK